MSKRGAGCVLGGLLFCVLGAAGAAAEDQDVVVLKNGQRVAGKIVQEDENAVFLKLAGGEERGIARARIEKIERAGAQAPAPAQPAAAVAAAPKASPAPLPAGGGPPNIANAEAKQLFEELKDLGHYSLEKRKAALDRAKQLGFRAMPVLLGLFNPDAKLAPEIRIGALRGLAELGPLDKQGAETLGWAAMLDRDAEVRREACRTIRLLKDDRSLSYILGFSTSQDKPTQYAAARALREINDDRAFAALAGAVPNPTVNANVPEESASIRRMDLPVGPGGANLPLYLPQSEVMGTADNISSPAADALKLIAGKDMGNLPMVWINWLNEKVGVWTQKEREEARRHRITDKMGSPQAQTGQ